MKAAFMKGFYVFLLKEENFQSFHAFLKIEEPEGSFPHNPSTFLSFSTISYQPKLIVWFASWVAKQRRLRNLGNEGVLEKISNLVHTYRCAKFFFKKSKFGNSTENWRKSNFPVKSYISWFPQFFSKYFVKDRRSTSPDMRTVFHARPYGRF